MRLLLVIPHFFNADGDGRHGSARPFTRRRLSALAACVTALHGNFGARQQMLDIARRRVIGANEADGNVVDVVICTTRGQHLLDLLSVPATAYAHRPTVAEPMLLPFECWSVLGDALGSYDYYCYMEDDLVIHDPWFFAKLSWFSRHAGQAALLQPNRYERDQLSGGRKVYVDGDIRPGATAPFQDVGHEPVLTGEVMGRRLAFRRPSNPHSGCYFLNGAQMSYWARHPSFIDRRDCFVGPLESAATLGIMRAFKVYKPALDNAHFLEVEHADPSFLGLIDRLPPAHACLDRRN